MTGKETVTAFYNAAFAEKDAAKSAEFLSEDFIHNGEKRGREGQKQVVEYFLTAFQDIKHNINLLLEDGEYITARQSWEGTHSGEFGGVQPTGKKITFDSTAILIVKDGLITEVWDCFDMYGIYKQMGEVPL